LTSIVMFFKHLYSSSTIRIVSATPVTLPLPQGMRTPMRRLARITRAKMGSCQQKTQ
jgi:hypothetical protein